MDKDIGVGILLGLLTGSTLYVYYSKSFSKSQKVFLYICVVFFPLQLLSILIFLGYNYLKRQNSPEGIENIKIKREADNSQKQLENLNHLRQQGILTQIEFNEKVIAIKKSREERELKQTVEYKKLKELLDNGILSQTEFKSKIEILKPGEIDGGDIIGHWENENNLLSFEQNHFTYVYKTSKGKGLSGKWSFDKRNNRIVILRDLREDYFQILKLSENEMVYQHKKSKFKFIKK